jgi:hypothetical protein
MDDLVSRLRTLNFMGPWTEAADVIEHLEEKLRMINQWQPIETAPKDNTVLLLCNNTDDDLPFIEVGYWETYKCWTGPIPEEGPGWEWNLIGLDPTHWMYMPLGPK